jgi:hypothetical protein
VAVPADAGSNCTLRLSVLFGLMVRKEEYRRNRCQHSGLAGDSPNSCPKNGAEGDTKTHISDHERLPLFLKYEDMPVTSLVISDYLCGTKVL